MIIVLVRQKATRRRARRSLAGRMEAHPAPAGSRNVEPVAAPDAYTNFCLQKSSGHPVCRLDALHKPDRIAAMSYLPPIDFLRECFSYDPETGLFTWRVRPDSHFSDPAVAAMCNKQNAGRRAFVAVDPDGYPRAELRYEGRRVRMKAHRVAFKLLTGDEPEVVDHIDGDTLNDKARNLRAATVTTNRWNSRGNKTSSLPKCVAFENGKFRAYARRDGRKIHLGSFDTPVEAHNAYRAFAAPLQGVFFNPGEAKASVFD